MIEEAIREGLLFGEYIGLGEGLLATFCSYCSSKDFGPLAQGKSDGVLAERPVALPAPARLEMDVEAVMDGCLHGGPEAPRAELERPLLALPPVPHAAGDIPEGEIDDDAISELLGRSTSCSNVSSCRPPWGGDSGGEDPGDDPACDGA